MKRTKKQIPPVESGKFNIVPPMSVRTGDVIYLPNYLSMSPSTLRSAGLSIGHTCRSSNREELIEKVFGPGHPTTFLVVMDANRIKRQNVRRTTLALPESFDNTTGTPDAPQAAGEDPGVLTSVRLMAIPRRSFIKDSVEASIEVSQMFSVNEWKNRLVNVLTSRVKDRLDELFVTRRRINRSVSLENREDIATWLVDAILEHAENTSGGITDDAVTLNWAGEIFRQDDAPSWMMDNVTEKTASALNRARYEFLKDAQDSWNTDDIDVSFHAQKFLRYITNRGCVVLRRADGKSILDVMDAQIVKETAAKMAARIQAVAAVFANVLAPALENATTAMYEMAGRWTAIRNDVDDEWAAVAETMFATEPGIKYGYGRRRSV